MALSMRTTRFLVPRKRSEAGPSTRFGTGVRFGGLAAVTSTSSSSTTVAVQPVVTSMASMTLDLSVSKPALGGVPAGGVMPHAEAAIESPRSGPSLESFVPPPAPPARKM